jgi:anti-sigma factor RsiW
MNDCPNGELRDRLPDLLHGRLTPEARREIEAHLAGCLDCREELELLRGVHASLRRAPAVDVGRIVAALPAPRRPTRRVWAGWRAAAAVVLIAAGGTSVVVARSRHVAGPAGASELAVGGGAIGDLNDRELSTLVKQMESLDPVPPADVENAAAVSPLPPPPGGGE